MSGHSKWNNIRRKKSKEDIKRGKIFTKLMRGISVAARTGGGDPSANPRLRSAIEEAREASMPNSNIERAIKKGTGELPGVNYQDVAFEGYGPGGTAIIIEGTTDNKNRTIATIRHIFEKYNGNLGEAGSVSWMFQPKGIISVSKTEVDEDQLTSDAIEVGAEDLKDEEDTFEIITEPKDFEEVKKGLQQRGIKYTHAELTKIPKATVKLEGKLAQQVLRLIEEIEDCDDVTKVFSNFDIDIEEMEKVV